MGDMQLKPELVQELCALRGERKSKADDLRIAGTGDNRPKSDIDLAFRAAMWRFTDDVNEKARTPLLFDVVDLERPRCPEAFRAEIGEGWRGAV